VAQAADPEQFHIMREHGTERPGSCALNFEKRAGTFSCAGCDQVLFKSKKKFESGTGWPSFNDPEPGSVEETVDRAYGMVRTRCIAAAAAVISARVSGRPAADGPALLHQWRCDELQAD
jgi:peptide methionine sulfoxide reductase MsrB